MGKNYSILYQDWWKRFLVSVVGYPFLSTHVVWYWMLKLVEWKNVKTVLDLGCGDGVMLNSLAIKFGISGVGMDLKENRLEMARKVGVSSKLDNKFVVGDITSGKMNLQANLDRFDVITVLDVLEHIEEPERMISYFGDYLNAGGRVMVRIPVFPDKKILLKEEKFGYGEDSHVHEGLKEEDVRGWFERAGFKFEREQYTHFFIGQLIYELSELVRGVSRLIYLLLLPGFIWMAGLDVPLTGIVKRKPNGLFLIFTKI